MPSHTDTAGHTKAFDYPVMDHWGETSSIVKFMKYMEVSHSKTGWLRSIYVAPLYHIVQAKFTLTCMTHVLQQCFYTFLQK